MTVCRDFVLGIALMAACASAGAQTIHKCVGKDGKTTYSADPCPGSKEIVAPSRPSAPPAAKGADAKKESAERPAAAGPSVFPEMQAGQWKLRTTKAGRVRDSEMCGDPIDGMRREIQEYAASTKWGCTMSTSASGPRSVNIVYDCPSDRSPDGRPVQKGRWELSVVSPTPQAFRIDMKSTADGAYSMEGSRIGNCN
ncbi:MAG: DUF4124 domain-containing protein [Pseudomonadota bacterium]